MTLLSNPTKIKILKQISVIIPYRDSFIYLSKGLHITTDGKKNSSTLIKTQENEWIKKMNWLCLKCETCVEMGQLVHGH